MTGPELYAKVAKEIKDAGVGVGGDPLPALCNVLAPFLTDPGVDQVDSPLGENLSDTENPG